MLWGLFSDSKWWQLSLNVDKQQWGEVKTKLNSAIKSKPELKEDLDKDQFQEHSELKYIGRGLSLVDLFQKIDELPPKIYTG